MSGATLTRENVRLGLRVVCIAHPEWGEWVLKRDRNGWIADKSGGGGGAMLWEREFKFWRLADTQPEKRAGDVLRGGWPSRESAKRFHAYLVARERGESPEICERLYRDWASYLVHLSYREAIAGDAWGWAMDGTVSESAVG
jgi:hypothetical protein